jgi:hypothetical protein
MLLSHRHRFLFVHIPKTGGTSIRSAMRQDRWLDPLFWPGILCQHISRLCQHRLGSMMPRHAPVLVAREMLPPTLFGQLFKFTFVRDPWDRLASGYGHFRRERQDLLREYRIGNFAEFVDWILTVAPDTTPRAALIRALRRPQSEYLVDWDGRLLVDFVGRYERLEEDFRQVTDRLQLKGRKLPHERRFSQRGDYRAMYTDALAERVGQVYASDRSAFCYRFDRRAA